MAENNTDKLVVAISTRALFDLDECYKVYEEHGANAYCAYQVANENVILAPGVAFSLVRKLLAFNEVDPLHPRVEVILLSRNSVDTGLRVLNSIEHYQLDITYAKFSSGKGVYRNIEPFCADIFFDDQKGHCDSAREHVATGEVSFGVADEPARRMKISVPGKDGKITSVQEVLEAVWNNPANALIPELDPAIQFGDGIMTLEEIERQEEILLREIARCPPRRAP